MTSRDGSSSGRADTSRIFRQEHRDRLVLAQPYNGLRRHRFLDSAPRKPKETPTTPIEPRIDDGSQKDLVPGASDPVAAGRRDVLDEGQHRQLLFTGSCDCANTSDAIAGEPPAIDPTAHTPWRSCGGKHAPVVRAMPASRQAGQQRRQPRRSTPDRRTTGTTATPLAAREASNEPVAQF